MAHFYFINLGIKCLHSPACRPKLRRLFRFWATQGDFAPYHYTIFLLPTVLAHNVLSSCCGYEASGPKCKPRAPYSWRHYGIRHQVGSCRLASCPCCVGNKHKSPKNRLFA